MAVTNDDLVRIMTAMQVHVDKLMTDIKKEIKNSNDNLGKEMREGREDMTKRNEKHE